MIRNLTAMKGNQQNIPCIGRSRWQQGPHQLPGTVRLITRSPSSGPARLSDWCQGRTNPVFSKPCLFLSDTRHFRHFRCFRGYDWKEGEDPHPQDKIQHLDFTKDPRPLYYKTPPCVVYHKNVCSRSLVRTKLALSKTSRFLNKAEILGVGVFSLLSIWGPKPLFLVGRMQIRHFRRFRQNGPFLARFAKNTAYPKTRLVPGSDWCGQSGLELSAGPGSGAPLGAPARSAMTGGSICRPHSGPAMMNTSVASFPPSRH